MKRFVTPLLLTCLVLASCVSYRLVPQGGGDSEIRYDRGKAVLSQLKDRIGVAVSTEVVGNYVYFHTVVKNFLDNDLNVDDSGTQLSEDVPQDLYRAPLKVYRADEFYQMRRGQIIAGQVLMAISAAMATANAGRSSSYTSGYYSVYGQTRNDYYSGYGTYSASTYTYDSAKAAMEREIAFANVRDYVNGTNQELSFLQNTLFYPSTVGPGEEYYGIIVSELGQTKDATMNLTLEFGLVQFDFVFHKEQISYSGY
jgi:hypothetical protein